MGMFRENSSVPAQLRTWGDTSTIKMFRDTKLNGGTTIDLVEGKVPGKTDGFFVGKAKGWDGKAIESIVINPEDFTLASLRRAVGRLYADHLTREEIEASKQIDGGYIGVWQDPETGLVWIDAVNWTADRDEAIQWGVERGELAIYDVAANGSLDLKPFWATHGVAA